MAWLRVVALSLATLLVWSLGLDQTGASAAPSGPASVTLVLRAPHPAALRTLAAERNVSRATRLRRLAGVLPSRRTTRSVVRRLRARGLHAVARTPWTVTVTGSPARLARTFGRSAPSGRLATPRSLRQQVAVALPTHDGRVAARPLTSGADYRAAYLPAGSSPADLGTGAGTTIATVQLGDWHSSDLTAYAAQLGVADPVASRQYQAVQVDGGAAYDAHDAMEVDLDQQALLATAPGAAQRAYFAPNTDAGFIDAFAAIVQDARNDPHLTAASVSWGGCEEEFGSVLSSYESVLQSLAAAGVTVFASSGDSGIYGCIDNHHTSVDYPASSPSVIGVGGTLLDGPTGEPNDGSNWTETAWSCHDVTSCGPANGGSGGGASAAFAKPSWQATALTAPPFAASTHRLVPDIAAVGDPANGFPLVSEGAWVQAGGTSLAAPVSAALFDDALVSSGRTTGVGDIHGVLYSAYAATQDQPATSASRAFRDVTSGQNGADADRGIDPSVAAGAGYDTVTGVGAPLWSAVLAFLPASPVVSAPAPTASGSPPTAVLRASLQRRHHRHTGRFTISWAATAAGPARVSGTSLVVVDRSTGRTVYRSPASTGRILLTGRVRHAYTVTCTATDSNGRTTRVVRSLHVPRH